MSDTAMTYAFWRALWIFVDGDLWVMWIGMWSSERTRGRTSTRLARKVAADSTGGSWDVAGPSAEGHIQVPQHNTPRIMPSVTHPQTAYVPDQLGVRAGDQAVRRGWTPPEPLGQSARGSTKGEAAGVIGMTEMGDRRDRIATEAAPKTPKTRHFRHLYVPRRHGFRIPRMALKGHFHFHGPLVRFRAVRADCRRSSVGVARDTHARAANGWS